MGDETQKVPDNTANCHRKDKKGKSDRVYWRGKGVPGGWPWGEHVIKVVVGRHVVMVWRIKRKLRVIHFWVDGHVDRLSKVNVGPVQMQSFHMTLLVPLLSCFSSQTACVDHSCLCPALFLSQTISSFKVAFSSMFGSFPVLEMVPTGPASHPQLLMEWMNDLRWDHGASFLVCRQRMKRCLG